MKLIVSLLTTVAAAAAAAAATEEGRSRRGAVASLERVGERVWTTSSGAAVICGGRRAMATESGGSAAAWSVERLQLSALLDSVCRYLENNWSGKTASTLPLDGRLDVNQLRQRDDVFTDISQQSVRYDDHHQPF